MLGSMAIRAPIQKRFDNDDRVLPDMIILAHRYGTFNVLHVISGCGYVSNSMTVIPSKFFPGKCSLWHLHQDA